MVTVIEIEEAKTKLNSLIALSLEGTEVILAEAGNPVVRLMPVPAAKKKRIPGLNRGQIKMHEDFDDPLPEELLNELAIARL